MPSPRHRLCGAEDAYSTVGGGQSLVAGRGDDHHPVTIPLHLTNSLDQVAATGHGRIHGQPSVQIGGASGDDDPAHPPGGVDGSSSGRSQTSATATSLRLSRSFFLLCRPRPVIGCTSQPSSPW